MKQKAKYPVSRRASRRAELKEATMASGPVGEALLRTQIYLSREEHEFVRGEASRRDLLMAAVIRGFIDERMKLPDEASANNPIFKAWPDDPDSKGHDDGGINLDHYLYGTPKRWIKVKGEYVEAPPIRIRRAR